MAGALTLADGRDKLAILTVAPVDPNAMTTTELAAGINGGLNVNRPDFRMSPTASDTVPDQPLGHRGNATTFGNGNFEASITVLRYLDSDGQSDSEDDDLWTAVKTPGTRIWLAKRVGPLESAAWAADDEYLWCEAITDWPQEPQDRAGYVKNIVPLGPQSWGYGKVVAGEG